MCSHFVNLEIGDNADKIHRVKRDKTAIRLFKKEREIFIQLFTESFLFLGSSVTVLSSLFDYWFAPQYFNFIFLARLISIPVAASCAFAYKFQTFQKKWYTWPAYFSALYMGVLHLVLFNFTGKEATPYLTGLCLATVSLLGTLPWQKRQIPVVVGLLWAPILIQVVILFNQLPKAHLWTDVSMVVITLFLGLRIFNNSHKLRISEFEKFLALEKQNQIQNEVIRKKTEEGVYLERLANQFSPQEIESIKNGMISLDEKKRQEVACIFIDVAQSTGRSLKIDHQNYSMLMEHFFSRCVKILLENDVTIGTYQGDGIMAISNAPKIDERYRQKAIKACTEILQFHKEIKDYYNEIWRSEFNIRVGISSGWATVGFFPNSSHGTYTALGDATNLAARLCSLAPANTIALPQDFLAQSEIPKDSVTIKLLEENNAIKGFEGENIRIAIITPEHFARTLDNHCPSCNIEMGVHNSQHDVLIFKCSKCNFRKISNALAFHQKKSVA